ncbi:hypothetical protein Hanom_Chr01g00085041 [Helianthus anomalus]
MTYKFWMYPRFMQIIIDTQVENLPKEEKNVLKIDVMTEHTLKVLKRISKYDEGPVPRKMIGYLGNPNYVTPANDKWTNEGSDSNNEYVKIDAMIGKRMLRRVGVRREKEKR